MRALLVGSLALFAACAPDAAQTRGERPLEVVVSTEAATLDPRFSTRSLDVKITRLVHAGLAGLDPTTLEPVPLLAKSFRMRDDRTLEVTLREGLSFHGGKALTAGDVCATLDAVRDPALGSPHRVVVAAIARCREEGPLRAILELGAPRATLLTDLEIPILRADEARSPPRPDGGLDGLGPFVISTVKAGEVTLVPAETGVLPRPHHVVVVRTVRDENARVQRLLAGRSDVAPNALSPALLPSVEQGRGVRIVSRPGANVTYLLFQNDRAPFDQVRVRHGVAYAIDRELIVRTLLGGRAQVATTLLPPGHWARGNVEPEPFSVEQARPRLAGLRAVTLLTSTDRSRVTLARAVAQMLGDAGLETRVVPLDLGAMLARLDAGDFDLAILQLPELTEPNVLSWFFHPRGIPGEGHEGKNRARYRSEIAGVLLDRASAISDRGTRKELYGRLAVQMARDLPAVPLWHEDQIAVISGRARGFLPSAEGRWLSLAGLE
ncbi:MAG TPA: ABC transporter substrate-binding protein [Polyangiaceae bacterium]